ncbi:hypothetical protein ABZW18_23260 [Streptomyces sp. NPDC004647]|uniref:hypothetical protein n=1 Tax=Streptomyces sp. NPDC004647 TaxID=3154671 RepID=UPI0033A842BA
MGLPSAAYRLGRYGFLAAQPRDGGLRALRDPQVAELEDGPAGHHAAAPDS